MKAALIHGAAAFAASGLLRPAGVVQQQPEPDPLTPTPEAQAALDAFHARQAIIHGALPPTRQQKRANKRANAKQAASLAKKIHSRKFK